MVSNIVIICTGLNGIVYCYVKLISQYDMNYLFILNKVVSISSINRTLTDIITTVQSGLRSYSNERVPYIPQRPSAEASPSNRVVSYTGHSFSNLFAKG